jgi:peptidoglycan/xylan/chitin deacetylase (PgdA/CDA1 family)
MTIMEVITVIMMALVFIGYGGQALFKKNKVVTPPEIVVPEPTPTASPSATPKPTPKPLSFAEMNKLYGPCTSLPILMYHHVESEESAKENKRTGLNVPPEIFKAQMGYLKTKGYTTVSPAELIAFFDAGVSLPAKPVMITFDDGYSDIGELAFPIMKELGIKATIYIPTGLMDNPAYLTWSKISEIKASGLITFGNHTWSHRNVGATSEVVKYELSTADTQLSEKGLGEPKTFVYPYGYENNSTIKLLEEMNYKLAFTTVNGRTMCEKNRFSLPRIRIGNAPLSVFGL